MEKIVFDSGVREYKLGNLGVLRFHPGDPNLYARFMEAAEKMKTIEEELAQQAKSQEDSGAAVVKLLQEADQKMKQTLNWVRTVSVWLQTCLTHCSPYCYPAPSAAWNPRPRPQLPGLRYAGL